MLDKVRDDCHGKAGKSAKESEYFTTEEFVMELAKDETNIKGNRKNH